MARFVLILTLLFILFGGSVWGQKLKIEDVPQAVLTGFYHHFPGQTATNWTLKANRYEIGFKKNGLPAQAVFTPDGDWLQTEYDLNEGGVPKVAFITIKKKYKNYRVTNIERVGKKDEKPYFQIELQRGRDLPMQAFFDLEGVLLRVEKPEKE